jgi:hypothetical protein
MRARGEIRVLVIRGEASSAERTSRKVLMVVPSSDYVDTLRGYVTKSQEYTS